MIDPMSLATVAGLGIKGLTEGAVQAINTKETQRTIRMQYGLNAAYDAGLCIQTIVVACQDHKNLVEQEQSKRQEIFKQETITLEKIRSQRDIFLTFLDASFDERERNFARLFDVLDRAIVSGDTQQVALILNQITDLAKSSPFKELQDLSKVQTALADSEHEWKF